VTIPAEPLVTRWEPLPLLKSGYLSLRGP
jgi:hypothetical protein